MIRGIQLVPLLTCMIFKHQNLKYQIMLHVLKTFHPFGYPEPALFKTLLIYKVRIMIMYVHIQTSKFNDTLFLRREDNAGESKTMLNEMLTKLEKEI